MEIGARGEQEARPHGRQGHYPGALSTQKTDHPRGGGQHQKWGKQLGAAIQPGGEQIPLALKLIETSNI